MLPAYTKHRSTIRHEVIAFRIWAAAKARDWKTSAIDLAALLELHRDTVTAIAAERGWRFLREYAPMRMEAAAIPVDLFIEART